jgi:hypothetical protein
MDYKLVRARYDDGSAMDSEANLATAQVGRRGVRVAGPNLSELRYQFESVRAGRRIRRPSWLPGEPPSPS